MRLILSFTDDDLSEDSYKTLGYTDKGKLFLNNVVDIKYIDFFQFFFTDYNEIVYYEDKQPVCPVCGCKMDNNGSRIIKPNKLEGIRKEQYICPNCGKTQVTSLEPFIKEYCNYSYDIGEKCLNYDYIGYLSYEKKAEMIRFENGVEMPRQTAYYFESIYDDDFLNRQEQQLAELLKQYGIEASGYYHLDEQYPYENTNPLVRLALIDAITQLPINELIIDKKDFDKTVVESFLESSLSGLPKIALVTDGAPMYPEIIKKIGLKHQLCIFHILKNHHDNSFKNINKVSRRINTINNNIKRNKNTIKTLEQDIKDNDYSKKKKRKKRQKIDKIKKENKRLRNERKTKKNELKELLNNNKYIENMYDTEDKKSATRRFNTLHNRKTFLDKNTCKFLENLGKKFDKTIQYYDDQLIPRTNNNIERYFGITLPHYIKRKYRTIKGLTRWLRLQRIRWIRRNVLHKHNLENIPLMHQQQNIINLKT